MALLYPVIGQWFTRPNGTLFEVVALDEDGGTVEVQQFDGTIDEYDLEAWPDLLLSEASAPEDWSGSVDIDPQDFDPATSTELPVGYQDALAFLDLIDNQLP
jgi:hypothetical protein